MKHLLIYTFVLMFSGAAYAQPTDSVETSPWSVGLNLGYDPLFMSRAISEPGSQYVYQSQRSFHFNMKAGYRLNENWEVLAGAGFKSLEFNETYLFEDVPAACHATRLLLQYMEAPLSVRRHFKFNQLHWFASTGFNQSFKIRGLRRVQACDASALWYYMDDEMPTWTPSASLGAGLRLPLTKQFSISAEGQWNYYLRHLIKDKQIRSHGFVAEVGFNWNFTK